MRHDMTLYEGPFASVKEGWKDIELRLNDEKRQKISAGDTIYFHSASDEYDVVITKVKALHHFKNFEELYAALPLERIGYSEEEKETASPSDMLEYYSRERIEKYGVLGIEIEKEDRDYYVDAHMHLEYGALTKEYVLEFVEEAVRKGLDEIDILDHTHRFKEFACCYEHLMIYEEQATWLSQKKKFCSSLAEYEKLIEEVRRMDLPIRVKFGLEVCYTKDTEETLRKILSPLNLDFLTGAVHSFNHILYDMPFSKELLWDRFSADDIYRDYYAAVMDCVRSGLFDRLAHPDTIKLFNIYPEYDLHDTYVELAHLCNAYGVRAECNTGCYYRYSHKDMGLSDEFLKVLKEEKTRIITASDAHYPEHCGNYILQATKRVKEAKTDA